MSVERRVRMRSLAKYHYRKKEEKIKVSSEYVGASVVRCWRISRKRRRAKRNKWDENESDVSAQFYRVASSDFGVGVQNVRDPRICSSSSGIKREQSNKKRELLAYVYLRRRIAKNKPSENIETQRSLELSFVSAFSRSRRTVSLIPNFFSRYV